MRTKLLPLLFLFVISHSPTFSQKNVDVAFTLKEKDLIPEGIAYDEVDNTFYVGSINKQKVVKISVKGIVTDFITTGQDGVTQVLGMKVDSKMHLWFCSNPQEGTAGYSAVFEYDLATAKLIRKYELKIENERHELNDLQFHNNEVYITDSHAGAIYKIVNETIELFLKTDNLRFSNGITLSPDGSKLLVSAIRGITSIDPATKEIKVLEAPFYVIGVDGLYRYKNSLIAIQNVTFPVSIAQFNLSSDTKIESANLLAVNHPLFDIPTTGVVVGDLFYFIGNSQLRALDAEGKIKSPEKLKDTVILKLPLR